MKNRQIWLVLPSSKNYFERFQTFVRVASHFESGHVVIVDEPDSTRHKIHIPIPTHVTLHFLGGKKWQKFVSLWHIATAVLNAKSAIVHDTFWSKLGLLVRLRKFWKTKPVIYVLSLYFPSPDFYFHRRWRQYAEGIVSLKNELMFLKNALVTIPFEYLSCKISHAIMGNSDDILDGVNKYYGVREHLISLPTSVDTDLFHPLPPLEKSPTQVDLERQANPDDVFQILGVGSIQRRKGWRILIEAVSQLVKEDIQVHVNLIYNIKEKDIDWFYKLLGTNDVETFFTIHPFKDQNELLNDYCRADVLVNTSYLEGSPRVVKEAMACGCPVIASDIAGIRILDPTGEWIQRFHTGSTASLAQCLINFWKQITTWRKKRPEIRQWVIHSFTPFEISNKIISCYDRLSR